MFHKFDELAESLDSVIKSGEGSRGGKIIGHTSSGKPIYDSKMNHIYSGVHQEYSAKDHKEAAQAHTDEKMKNFHKIWQELKGDKRPLVKGLTFDPMNPQLFSPELGYYNPYQQVDGAYLPYSADYWEKNGKDLSVDGYENTRRFYKEYFGKSQALKDLSKAIESDLFKAGIVPVGTVHVYRNGDKYRKVAEGRWEPIGEKNAVKQPQHNDLERDASVVNRLKEEIKTRQKDEQTANDHTARTHTQLKEFASAIFGGEMPESVKAHFDKHEKTMASVDPKNIKDNLKKIEPQIQSKSHKVTITFTIGGKEYNHVFNDVGGMSQTEVAQNVSDLIKKKIPGASISHVKAEINKDKAKKNYINSLKEKEDGPTNQARH